MKKVSDMKSYGRALTHIRLSLYHFLSSRIADEVYEEIKTSIEPFIDERFKDNS